MKKTNLISCLCMLLLFSCTHHKYPHAVNPNLIPEAKALLQYLYSIRGTYTLSGQHNYGHELLRSTDSTCARTGEYPVIWGSDLGSTGNSFNNREHTIQEAIRQYQKGCIITLMLHQARPFDDEPADFKTQIQGKLSDEQWQQLVTPGTDIHNQWLHKIDEVAGYLKMLQHENIPVLWRPYHEMNGIWFWWGDKKGPNGFQKLWHMMYDRYVNHHQLNNLIWVWNANAPRDWENDQAYAYEHYFPGTEYVDILAADVYKNDFKQSHHDDLLELAREKLIALGEVGVNPTPEILEQQPDWVWFMTWARFNWQVNTAEKMHELYASPRVLSLDDLY